MEVYQVKKTNKKYTTSLVLCFLILMMSVNVSGFEIEPGPCEMAFFRCFEDPLWRGAPIAGLFHCILGYAFCKKYIDSVK